MILSKELESFPSLCNARICMCYVCVLGRTMKTKINRKCSTSYAHNQKRDALADLLQLSAQSMKIPMKAEIVTHSYACILYIYIYRHESARACREHPLPRLWGSLLIQVPHSCDIHGINVIQHNVLKGPLWHMCTYIHIYIYLANAHVHPIALRIRSGGTQHHTRRAENELILWDWQSSLIRVCVITIP